MKLKALLIGLLAIFSALKADLPYYPTLLIKMPTRSRPETFFKRLDAYYANLSGLIPYHFVISCDADDATMNNEVVRGRLSSYQNLSVYFGNSSSKVEAYNADIEKHSGWDIVLVTSDDLVPAMFGYDKIMVDTMNEHFPDYDGVLSFHDGMVGGECNTYPVIGKKFYDRFGYIYSPAYKSLFCDEELTLVARKLNREFVSDEVLIKHYHAVHGLSEWDDLYRRNEALKSRDEPIFQARREHSFDVTNDMWQQAYEKEWSILILTLEERSNSFQRLYNDLQEQLKRAGLEDKVEILYYKDNGEASVGHKRNQLLALSKGRYVCFVDDDDAVHSDYVSMIYPALLQHPDCVSLKGVMTHRGNHRREFVHSLKYTTYSADRGVYFRPPNHLNPMRRDVAILFPFPEIDHGEDKSWAMRVAESGLLKKEVELDEPYYFYYCSDNPLSRYY